MAKLLAAPTKNAVQKTLAAQLLSSAGASDPITFADVDGIPNLPGVLVINRVNSSGTATPSSREYIEYSGTSGSTVLITTRNVDGSNAALTHAVGSIVEFIPDITWADRIYDALATLIDVDNNTTIKTGLTLTSPILSGAYISGATLSSPTLLGTLKGNVTLGMGVIYGNATLSGNIDLAGNTTSTGNITSTGDMSIKRRKTPIFANGNAGASLAVNLNNGETQTMTLTISMATISLTNVEEGDYLTLYAIQDATGSRKITFAQSGGSIKYAAGASIPSLTTTASAVDVLGIRAFNASVTHVIASALDIK